MTDPSVPDEEPSSKHRRSGERRPDAPLESPSTGRLDPPDWDTFRATCHQVVDEMVERFQHQAEGPVWTPIPAETRERLAGPLASGPQELDQVLDRVRTDVLPFTLGNTHPRFFGWVHGSGTPAGALAEFLAGTMNANTGGRDHAPILVEEQLMGWVRETFGFPDEATGMVVSGTSMATIVGLAVARHGATEGRARNQGTPGIGVAGAEGRLVGYATADGHQSIRDAFSLLGLGADALRPVPMKADGSMDPEALGRLAAQDRADGLVPFAVVATSGSVTCGAMDDLVRIREVADAHGLWMHVDAAFGAAARLSPALAPRLEGIERADSLAFDFHKWFHAPYEAGCVLVRDGELHRATFGGRADYLTSLDEGPAAGETWPCDLGPELSRGFRAFKVWFTLQHLGAEAIGASAETNVRQAGYLARRVRREAELELLAPADLNIVCLRYRPAVDEDEPFAETLSARELNALNREILLELHTRGIAIPSPIRRGDAFGLRVCLCNHRTREADLDLLVSAVLELGRSLVPVA